MHRTDRFIGKTLLAAVLMAALFPAAGPAFGAGSEAEGQRGSSAADTVEAAAAEDAKGTAVSEDGEENVDGEDTEETAVLETAGETIRLRVCNWEEYIDLGDWDEEETIELPSGDIIGEQPMIKDFEDWYLETFGRKVKVEYSTFGTNEDLYNMLMLGDVYDLVCPSEYMIMKLMAKGLLVPLSDEFLDPAGEYSYYSRGQAPFIGEILRTKGINGENWAKYAAGYMWGITGIVYNPELVTEEEASTWKILSDPAFRRRVTIKDNVRDSYFAAVGAIKSDLLTSEDFLSDPDYALRLEQEMNDTSPEMIARVQEWLRNVRDNAYSFETESGKADMITGKVAVNYQWSGDGVYTMDQADEDDFTLAFTVPKESTNFYFDGWVMLKAGIGGDADRQHAAEAFINFISRPDNAIRNMYYTGYTSVLSGGDDPRLFEYAAYNYEAEDDEEETAEYDLGYFFSEQGEDEGKFVLEVPADQLKRQVSAAYPPEEDIARSSIMAYFNDEQNAAINQMWVNVRCFDIREASVWGWILICAAAAGVIWLRLRRRRRAA